jgi:16S rRNA (cytosine1402-N4)-methyltransferase
VQASYTTLSEQLKELGWDGLDGIVLDLGASSMQFDTPERGFSFLQDAPLDMRFDPDNPLSANEIVNDWDEKTLADTIYEYGEERRSRQVAKAILKARPIKSTKELAQVVSGAVQGPRQSRIHPATRTFQALRMAVNHELEAIESVLPQALKGLNPGGRMAVISFHSLEDRIIKHFFRQHSRDETDPSQPKNPVIHPATLKLINRKPILPNEEEALNNPRARSAKLRVVEKL